MTEQWWKSGIVYQIYPRSFQDTDGDGVGDLEGIVRRLDYLADLGVDAIWISPIFVSPMADFGYDVADYCAVDPLFGSLETFDRLVAQAHARGLKVILDFVPNHTSDQHPWFKASRSSRGDPKRDWYIWRDGRLDGGPPNNWVSNFGGSAWETDEATGQFYYHAFLKEQPDLNWRNPDVREAMCDVLRFWMQRGVDGFRIDVLWHLMKDAQFRDNPPNPGYHAGQAEIEKYLQTYSADQPDIFDILTQLRASVDEFPDRVLIGEIYLPVERLMAYYGRDHGGVHLPFNFQLLDAAWSAKALAGIIAAYEAALPQGGWPNWVLSNHDRPRIAARVGAAQARVAAMLLLTLRGTPTMYYGDELGLGRIEIPRELVQDPWEKREPGLGLGRDPSRTPMLWDDSPNAGFTKGVPWLPLGDDWQSKSVVAQTADPASILSLYRALIALRRVHAVLRYGAFRLLSSEDDVLIYERFDAKDAMTIVLNLSAESRKLSISSGSRRLILSSGLRPSDDPIGSTIAGNTGYVFLQT
jgi:alpha-glucosidase